MPDAAAASQQIGELERLAGERFTDSPLTIAELNLLQAAPTCEPAVCAPADLLDADNNANDKLNPLTDVSQAEKIWGKDRQVRADLIRWLCVDQRAKDLIDPKGIQVSWAVITGELDLSFVTIPFPLTLQHCRLLEKAYWRAIDIPAINLQGTRVKSLDAESAKVKSSVQLCDEFVSEGTVSIQGAEIDGELNCNGSTFNLRPKREEDKEKTEKEDETRWFALRADYAIVKCGVSMSTGKSAEIRFQAYGEVGLRSAQIDGGLLCVGGQFMNPFKMRETQKKDDQGNVQRTWIAVPNTGNAPMADGAVVKGGISLDNSNAEGEVSFRGAQLGGTLDCSGATFSNPWPAAPEGNDSPPTGGTGSALDADGVVIGNHVLLSTYYDDKKVPALFKAEGAVRFMGAQIGGSFVCINGSFKNPLAAWVEGPRLNAFATTGTALIADGAVVKGNVFLRDGFRAEGQVRFMGAQIGGTFECTGSTFANPALPTLDDSGTALTADSMSTSGNVYLNDDFDADGDVRLHSAQIGGELNCTGARFRSRLIADYAVVKGTFSWWNLKEPKGNRVSLINASVGALTDTISSWPQPPPEAQQRRGFFPWHNKPPANDPQSQPKRTAAEQKLDGFVYGHITGATKDPDARLDWLRRQSRFSSQPYLQLAKVLRDEGDDAGARHVLFEMEDRRRRQKEGEDWGPRIWRWTLKGSIGYGYYSQWCLYWLAGVIVLGFAIFWAGYSAGLIVPVDDKAYASFKTTHQPPDYYGQFHALAYSFENSFPVVKLGQADRWQPDPSPAPGAGQGTAKLLAAFHWFQILAGWFLASLGVAGISGVIRKD